jgi:hypothetical protein
VEEGTVEICKTTEAVLADFLGHTEIGKMRRVEAPGDGEAGEPEDE